jgi:hypothetical protein
VGNGNAVGYDVAVQIYLRFGMSYFLRFQDEISTAVYFEMLEHLHEPDCMVSYTRVPKRKYSDTQRCRIMPSNVAIVSVYFGAQSFLCSMPKHWFPSPNTKHFAIVACAPGALTSICTAVEQTFESTV